MKGREYYHFHGERKAADLPMSSKSKSFLISAFPFNNLFFFSFLKDGHHSSVVNLTAFILKRKKTDLM